MLKFLYERACSIFTITVLFCLIQTTTSQVLSLYSGDLSSNSAKFSRPTAFTGDNSYYHAIQVSISTTGSYSFISNSTVDLCAYFYSDSFDETNPSRNLVTSDDNTGNNKQFQINVPLLAHHIYVLIVTTSVEAEIMTGSFSISTDGPASVLFKPFVLDTTTTPFSTTSSLFTTSTSIPLIPSYYDGTLSRTSPTFTRPVQTSGSYYYQAIQVTISTRGEYTFRSTSSLDTYGYFYSGSFDPLNPSRNLIASDDDSGGSGQFLLNVTLTAGGTYILVVTTYAPSVTGTYSIRVLGPSPVSFAPYTPTTTSAPTTTTSSSLVPSSYSGSLSSISGRFIRPGQTSGSFYYQAIQVTIYSNGKYTFRSSSALDTYGLFYSGSFDPLNPSRNLIASDDDSGGNYQFLLNVTLTSGGTYILVVTTYAPNVIGTYSVTALGPSSVNFYPFTPTTPVPPITTPSPLVPSYYSSSLSSNSAVYIRPGQSSRTFYYEAIQIYTSTSGNYILRSSSVLDTYGYLYADSFDPLNPSQNLIASDDDSGGNQQFLLNTTLTYGRIYILVVTTYASRVTGSYGVAVLGPARVSLFPYQPTTPAPPTTTTAPLVPSSYSGSLSSNSGRFIRPGQTSGSYYYQAIRVTVYTTGKYTFRSTGSLDTYGYFYSGSFDPSNPSQNLIASDDDSGGSGQFLLNVTLTYGGTYVLVVTTYAPNVLGYFTVNSLGPAVVSWTALTPSFISQLSVIEISAMVIGCVVFVGIVLSACVACRRKGQRTINRTAVYSMFDEKIQPVGTNENQMPYVISVGSSDEKPSLANN